MSTSAPKWQNITKTTAIYHFTSWADATNYCGGSHSLNLAPSNLEFLAGEHMRNLISDSRSPASMRTFNAPLSPLPRSSSSTTSIFTKSATGVSRPLPRTYTFTDSLSTSRHGMTQFFMLRRQLGSSISRTNHTSLALQPIRRKFELGTNLNLNKAKISILETLSLGRIQTFLWLEICSTSTVGPISVSIYATQQGLTWHIDVWSNTVLYSAGATIIAINWILSSWTSMLIFFS